MNRRQWLKTSTFAATGMLVGSNFPSCGPGSTTVKSSSQEPGILKLNSNESPYGVSPNARNSMIDAMGESHLYPHQKYAELIELIAEREKLTPDHIVLGGGSTEVMNMIIRAFGSKGTILVSNPTYFDFLYYAELASCVLEHIPLTNTFEHDLESTEETLTPQTGLVYVCNPNNPTGSITSKAGLSAFCERSAEKAVVVVDEAYHDYVEDSSYSSMMDLVRRDKNVIVTRTFSKIFGMAGLRIGYGVAKPETIARLKRVEMNFAPIAFPSLRAAVSSYADIPFFQTVLEKNRFARAYLCKQLDKMGYTYIPSHTNFVLFEVKRPAEDVSQELKRQNILVRPFQFWGRQWIRVSLGTLKDMQTFASTLANLNG